MGINNPVPRSLGKESRKAAKILASFVKPNQILGQDTVIPRHVLANAKGLAVLTQLKAGFLFSGRAGSGVIVARLNDGSWSAPSAIITAGAGVGGQIGAELTDFVFILNTQAAVDTFSQAGSITLGGNVSVALGPLGRNAEAAGSASLKSVAAIFAYSKTKGLFAGVSLEGSALIERRDANKKFYGQGATAKRILSGRVEAPPECDILFRVLDSRAFGPSRRDRDYDYDDDVLYDDIPDDFSDDSREYQSTGRQRSHSSSNGRGDYSDRDDYYYNDLRDQRGMRSYSSRQSSFSNSDDSQYFKSTYSDDPSRGRKQNRNDSPLRPSAAKPVFRQATGRPRGMSDAPLRYDRERKEELSREQERQREASEYGEKAIALYSFSGEKTGDLGFRKGDIITVIKRTNTQDDWWTGRKGGVEGIFPANYVELV